MAVMSAASVSIGGVMGKGLLRRVVETVMHKSGAIMNTSDVSRWTETTR